MEELKVTHTKNTRKQAIPHGQGWHGRALWHGAPVPNCCLGTPKALTCTVLKAFVFEWKSDAMGLVQALIMSEKGYRKED